MHSDIHTTTTTTAAKNINRRERERAKETDDVLRELKKSLATKWHRQRRRRQKHKKRERARARIDRDELYVHFGFYYSHSQTCICNFRQFFRQHLFFVCCGRAFFYVFQLILCMRCLFILVCQPLGTRNYARKIKQMKQAHSTTISERTLNTLREKYRKSVDLCATAAAAAARWWYMEMWHVGCDFYVHMYYISLRRITVTI